MTGMTLRQCLCGRLYPAGGSCSCARPPVGSKRAGSSRLWRATRMQVLQRDGFRCVRCGVSQDELIRDGQALEAHHRDGNRNNNDLPNLETLCPGCHRTA